MGYVYLIHDENNDTYKIGVTRKKSNTRIKKLQTGNSTKLYIIYLIDSRFPFRLETMLHNYFKEKHVLNEWYSLDLKDVELFPKLCEKYNNIIIQLLDNPFFNKRGVK